MKENNSTINSTEKHEGIIRLIPIQQQKEFDVNVEEYIKSIDTIIDIFLDDYFSDLV